MTKKILIALNLIGIIGTIYWISIEQDLRANPEPVITFVFSLINLFLITNEEKIDKRFFSRQNIRVNQNNGTIAGSVQNLTNNYNSNHGYRTIQELIPQNTKGNNASMSENSITGAPTSNNIDVLVNGMIVKIGDGVITGECYFSSDNGITAKRLDQIGQGDKLYWNGIIAGYDIGTKDTLELRYN